jgi:Chromo (CHRromatin Organisation MOdifier) domain
MSTAFHPQTDGQTERTNRTIEQILRCYVDYRQRDWDALLPLVEFSLNNAKSSSTGASPFFLNSGFHPLLPLYHGQSSDTPAAQNSFSSLHANLTLAKDLIRRAQDTQKHYANLRRRDLTFSPGDQVLLDSSHITPDFQLNRPSKKLAAKWIGPFIIVRRIGNVSYTLALPDTMAIHPTFHVSRLKPYVDPQTFHPLRDPDSHPPLPVIIDNEEEFEIDTIHDKRLRRKRVEYLVHWKGYPHDDHTEDCWLPLDSLGHATELVDDFEDSLPLATRLPSSKGGDV